MGGQQQLMLVNRNVIQIALLGAVIFLILLLLHTCGAKKESENLYEAANDSLRVERNERGQEVARIRVLESQSKKDFLKLRTKDATILHLQELVKEYKGKLNTAIVLYNTTTTIGSTATEIVKWDTLENEIYPQYKAEWDEEWSVGKILATKDSIHREIKIYNKFEITLGKENNGWFKKRESEVKVTNLNPNTITNELRAFNLENKQKRVTLGFSVGYGITSSGLSPYAGVGVNVNLIGVK